MSTEGGEKSVFEALENAPAEPDFEILPEGRRSATHFEHVYRFSVYAKNGCIVVPFEADDGTAVDDEITYMKYYIIDANGARIEGDTVKNFRNMLRRKNFKMLRRAPRLLTKQEYRSEHQMELALIGAGSEEAADMLKHKDGTREPRPLMPREARQREDEMEKALLDTTTLQTISSLRLRIE